VPTLTFQVSSNEVPLGIWEWASQTWLLSNESRRPNFKGPFEPASFFWKCLLVKPREPLESVVVSDWCESVVECPAGKGSLWDGGSLQDRLSAALFSSCAADLHWWQFLPGRPKTSCGGLGHEVGLHNLMETPKALSSLQRDFGRCMHSQSMHAANKFGRQKR
jgi:hypothetical protein